MSAFGVDEAHAAIRTFLDALSRIERACKTHAAAPFSPALDDIRKVATAILESITNARPDLRGVDFSDFVQTSPEGGPGPRGAEIDAKVAEVAKQPPVDTIAVVNHMHAKRLLEDCEVYYRRYEPSSAALLLVTQARLLIGRPLIEALETLLPKHVGQAIIDFGQQTGFQITYERLKQLSESPTEPDARGSTPDFGPAVDIRNAQAAVAAIRSVEDYFRKVERSSPVPALLQRARSYLDRDFQSLVDELIPRGNKN